MNIGELHEKLSKFILEHPKCLKQEVMVKSLEDDSTWEEVTLVTDTVNENCPEYGSPLYFRSPSETAVTTAYQAKVAEENARYYDDDFEPFM